MRIDSTRERRATAGFGWVDHRVVRGGHLAALGQSAVAVYLVLCVVADRKGISYYSAAKLALLVKHSAGRVEEALSELSERGLIAREGRFVQVLALEHVGAPRGPDQAQAKRAAAERVVSPPVLPPAAPAKAASKPPPASADPQAILAGMPAEQASALLEEARRKLSALYAGHSFHAGTLAAFALGLLDKEPSR